MIVDMPMLPTPLPRALVRGSAAAALGALLLMSSPGPAMAVTDGSREVSLTVTATSPAAASSPLPAGWRREMLDRVNGVRAAVGVAPVHACAALRRSAQEYAMVMASTNSYGHVGPDGTQPWDRMTRQGYRWRSASENIAAGQRAVQQVVDAWITSPRHYATLVNPRLRHVGFGFAFNAGSTYRAYWVQDFGLGSGC